MVNVLFKVFVPRNQPFVVYKLFFHPERRSDGCRSVALWQVILIKNLSQGWRVVLVEDHRFDFGNGFSIPKVAAHVDIFARDIGKKR